MMNRVPGVYVSYPFCAQKCTFCNFASGLQPRAVEDLYPEALLHEIEAADWKWVPETVYIGGGTPSSLDPERLADILHAIPGRPWREATLECAPGTIDAAKAAAWKQAGITRVSLGVQSFVTSELARVGRKHTAEVVTREIAVVRAAGIAAINIDLIAGLPRQTDRSWDESLDWIERLAPLHVSVYMFEVDEDSRLGAEVLAGGIRYGAGDIPSESAVASFYERAVERLREFGIERYEISNFARPGSESVHNLKYWKREPYLGFGADAHSFDGGLRWQNVETATEYIERSPHARIEQTAACEEEEKFFVSLRLTEGIELNAGDWLRHGRAIERFRSHGLVMTEGDRLALTNRGVLVSNEILQEFLPA